MINSIRPFKASLLAGLVAGPMLAFNAMAVPETDYHWSPSDIAADGSASFEDPLNWDSGFAPSLTNSAGFFIRTMVNQGPPHNLSVITNDTVLYQLMIGTTDDGSGGGDLSITNGSQVVTGTGLAGAGTQWTGVGFPGGTSSLYVGPGASLTCGDHIWIGNGANVNDVGTVTVDGGWIKVQGQFGLGWNGYAGTTNYCTLKHGGHLILNQWAGQTLGTATCVGILNLADSSSYVTVNGNVTSQFAAVTNNARLIAYGGAGTITWNYNPSGNLTTINAVAPPDPQTPIFSLQPTTTIAALGAPATLHALVSNVGVNYQWLFNTVPISDGGAYSGTHTANLTIASVNGATTGNYSVIATNSSHADHTTLSATAGVSADSFTFNPVITINGIVGNTYVAQYTASLTPPVVWTPFATNTLGTPVQYVIDLSSPMSNKRFYQVVQTAP
jgi:hypothetical protein